MKLYLLYYDKDEEAPENWNVYHTPCEVFSSSLLRERRIIILQGKDPDLEFHSWEVTLDAVDEDFGDD